MKKSAAWMGAGGVVIAACVVGWVIARSTGEPMTPLATSPPDAAGVATDALEAPAVSPIPAVALDRVSIASRPAPPPPGTPFNQAVEALEIAARAGDPVAACRLAAEAFRCQSTRQMAAYQSTERQIEQMAGGNLDAAQLEKRIDAWLRQKQTVEKTLKSCEGVDTSPVQLARYDIRATELGDPLARTRYLMGTHLNPGTLMRHPELLDHYRTHAFDYFTQALETGHPSILLLWHANTQYPDMQALPAVLPEPWREPGLVGALIAQFSDAQRAVLGQYIQNAALDVEVSPEQHAEAARIHARYFSTAQPLQELPFAFGSQGGAEHCEDLPAQ